MSTDEATTKDLVETLEDGRRGFAKGADKLSETNRPELASTFRRLSDQRAQFSHQLRTMANAHGDQVDEDGSAAAALHRGWMSLKDALSGSDADGVLDAAEQGEDHAVKEYQKALAADISIELRAVIERQYVDVKAAHDEVRALRARQR
jgi:uncharacterized protein (TIGR02284 family)